jgi:hypothetical protein
MANRNSIRNYRCRGLPTTPKRHTKKADSAKRQRMWAEIANSVLTETGDEGRAIREANAAVGRDHAKSAGPS